MSVNMRKVIIVARADWLADTVTSEAGEIFDIATRHTSDRADYTSGNQDVTAFYDRYQKGDLIILEQTELSRGHTPLWKKVEEET